MRLGEGLAQLARGQVLDDVEHRHEVEMAGFEIEPPGVAAEHPRAIAGARRAEGLLGHRHRIGRVVDPDRLRGARLGGHAHQLTAAGADIEQAHAGFEAGPDQHPRIDPGHPLPAGLAPFLGAHAGLEEVATVVLGRGDLRFLERHRVEAS